MRERLNRFNPMAMPELVDDLGRTLGDHVVQDPVLSDASGEPEQGKLPPPLFPSPRIRVLTTEGGHAIEPASDGSSNRNDFRASFLAAFGTVDELVAEGLFEQLLNGLQIESDKPVEAAKANLALALMHEIAPRDVVEGILATQMIVAHVAAMDASRRALHGEQTPGGRQAYLSLTRKGRSVRGL
jgi:hypothetical protein